MASAAARSYWGAQGSAYSDDGMYHPGATAGTAGTAGTAAGAGAGTGTGTSGTDAAAAGAAGTTSGNTGSQDAGSQAESTWQGSSGQSWDSGASSGASSTSESTQGQTWAQGQTAQSQTNAQQPAAQNRNGNTNSNGPSSGSQGSTQQSSSGGYDDGMWDGDNNGQSTNGQSASNSQGETDALNQDSTSGQWDQTNNGQGQFPTDASKDPSTDPSSTTTTSSTTSPSSTSSDLSVHEPSALPSTSDSHRLSPGSEAGIAIGVMGLVLIVLGLIFYRLHRKKRALQEQMRKEKNMPAPEKQNRMYSLASNLYTKSSLTLVGISEAFKGSHNNSAASVTHEHPIQNQNMNRRSIANGPPAANESTSTIDSTTTQLPPPVLFTGETHPALRRPTWKGQAQRVAGHVASPFTVTASYAADKVRGMRKEKLTPAQRRSLQAHEYGFSEEFLHIPPPPEPTLRLPRVLTKTHIQPPPPAQLQDQCECQCPAQHQPQLQAQPQPQPQPVEKADNGIPSWSTMTSLSRLASSSEEHQEEEPRFPLPCEIIGEELFRVRSVSCGTVAMNNPAAKISVDALAGRISEDEEQSPQQPQPQSQSQSKSRSPSPPHPPPAQPTPVYQLAQPEVTSFKPSSVTVYRIDMPFKPRSTGQLEVSEGIMVRLDQAFDDGWALCTIVDTEQRGVIPRACLSTWPMKDRRNYAGSVTDPHIRNASSASLPISPVESVAQSLRFYRQHSRSGTPNNGVISPASSTASRS
ncbi:hypothetical protein BDV06DRAFT_235689 [Aspergillus oleicola]